ncbi:MAG: hypothetical protein V3V31_04515 [Methylococcales bacterium]
MQFNLDQDLHTLKQVGVENWEELVSAAAYFVRHQPLYRVKVSPHALTSQEEAFLRRAGASGVGDDYDANAIEEKLREAAVEYGQMVASAYSQKGAAECIGVTPSRVRQRIDQRTLYAIDTPHGRVCPKWQFTEEGATLPGIDAVLPLISVNAHPVAVQRFFLTPQVDLEDDVDSEVVQFSPVRWLETGHSPKEVMLLARAL